MPGIRATDLTPRCPIPDCSRCHPESSPELLEALQRLRRVLAPAPRTALLAFGLTADEARNTH